MYILVLSQRDIKHPSSGGAELYLHNALKVAAGKHKIVHLSIRSPRQSKEEHIDGIHYIRDGKNSLQVIVKGLIYYLRNRKQINLVIDHSNTHQFLTFAWARRKRVFFIHQLAQEIGIYFFGPVIGRLVWWCENLLLHLSRGTTITVSQSTRKDLMDKGFRDIYVCPEGNFINNTALPGTSEKEDYLVYVGRLVPYKRVEDALLLAQKVDRDIKIIGSGPDTYLKRLKKIAAKEGVRAEFLGRLKTEEKNRIIEKAFLQIMPSIREGWGLVITESANLGTPSLVYPRPGVIEAVNHGEAGFLAGDVGVRHLVEAFNRITPEIYSDIRQKSFAYSLEFTWEETAKCFADIIDSILTRKYGPSPGGATFEQTNTGNIDNLL
ncbi:MAG: glycosyltransferase family 4 protein [Bacillota bacterium]